MGLSIHFSGRLRKAEYLPALIEEIKDVSNIYGWRYHIFNTHFPNDTFENQTSFENVYGISFTPTKCETVSFAFLSNGIMVYDSLLDNFELSMQTFPTKPGEDIISYFERLMRHVDNLKK